MENKKTITLKNAAESYLTHLGDTGVKKNTIGVYKRALDLAVAHFGEEKKLTGIMVPHVSRFFDSKEVNFHPDGRPKAKPTILQVKRVFRQCLQFAKDQGLITILAIPKSELQHARKKNESQKTEHPKQESPTK